MANLALISELIKQKKMMISDFCEQSQITNQTLREMIKRNSTKTDILERIANVLNVPVGYFFNEYSGIVVNGKNNQVHSGQGNQIMLSPEQREIEHLREIIKEKNNLLEEKERLIQMLMQTKS